MNRRLASLIIISVLTVIALSALIPVVDRRLVVPWKQVPGILSSGKVSSVLQAHDLTVLLVFRDGTMAITKEPRIDQIGQELAACGNPCNGILYATE